MKTSSIKKILIAFTLFAVMAANFYSVSAQGEEEEEDFEEDEEGDEMTAFFVNEHPYDEIELFWIDPELDEDDPERFRFEATLAPRGGTHETNTFEGHEFFYEWNGEENYIPADRPNANNEQLIVLSGNDEGIRVRCDITVNSGTEVASFDILVQSYWAPRGAVRFLELVRQGYYDGVVFNRVVPKFLIQFGIGKDYETRTNVQDIAIWDDYDSDVPFQPGFLSFAGTGPDSRTGELFIVMPGASTAQLSKFGENDWETPFGFVEGDLSVLNKIYSGYGDMVSHTAILTFLDIHAHIIIFLSSLHGAKVLTPNLFMLKTDTLNIFPPTSPNLIVSNLVTLLTKSACTRHQNSNWTLEYKISWSSFYPLQWFAVVEPGDFDVIVFNNLCLFLSACRVY
jgi:cyclophilin family peptidyl-prolyl cis-trans isomerase